MDEDELQEAPRPIQHSKVRPIIISVLIVFVLAIVVGSVVLGAQLASRQDPNAPNPAPSTPSPNPPNGELPKASFVENNISLFYFYLIITEDLFLLIWATRNASLKHHLRTKLLPRRNMSIEMLVSLILLIATQCCQIFTWLAKKLRP